MVYGLPMDTTTTRPGLAEDRDFYDNLHDSIPSDVPSTVWESDAASRGAGA